jgi:hypothetical protein
MAERPEAAGGAGAEVRQVTELAPAEAIASTGRGAGTTTGRPGPLTFADGNPYAKLNRPQAKAKR